MNEETPIPINITIADRTYRIKALAKDEEVIRKTIKLINEKIVEFKTRFAGKDMQDYIAMVIIWYATDAAARPQSNFDEESIKLKLSEVAAQLDEIIKS